MTMTCCVDGLFPRDPEALEDLSRPGMVVDREKKFPSYDQQNVPQFFKILSKKYPVAIVFFMTIVRRIEIEKRAWSVKAFDQIGIRLVFNVDPAP